MGKLKATDHLVTNEYLCACIVTTKRRQLKAREQSSGPGPFREVRGPALTCSLDGGLVFVAHVDGARLDSSLDPLRHFREDLESLGK